MGNQQKIHQNTGRFQELQEQFLTLEHNIQDPDLKQAFSLLHGMVQEIRRGQNAAASHAHASGVQQIADLYLSAPKMEAEAVCEPLEVGREAPDFSLPDASGKMVSLRDFRGKKVLLVFYPLDWSPGCSVQLDLYQQELENFERLGVTPIGISVDSLYSHGAWAAVRGITFPLLADFHPKGGVAQQYRVYREQDGFSERALYLIDEEGVIRYSYLSPYLHHVPDVYELLRIMEEHAKPAVEAELG